MTTILRTNVVSRFSCLGDKCPDTCCRGWSMQVDETTLTRYKTEAPELLSAVEAGGVASPWIMRKDAKGVCVKFEGGLCGIHKTRGDKFLGDACHFYPRITRGLGDQMLMSATASCPEIMRLALEEKDLLSLTDFDVERLPESMKNYLLEEMTSQEALSVHQAFLQAASDESARVETVFARIASVSRSLERLQKKDWSKAIALYLKLADGRLSAPEMQNADPFNILHALMGLIVASRKPVSERLRQTLSDMEKALGVTLDWEQVLILPSEGSLAASQRVQSKWKEKYAQHHSSALRKFLLMQLSMGLFPFAGLGDTLTQRITFIGVRLATVRLAIMCACDQKEGVLDEENLVRIIQSLSRFLDHLADPTFSLQIYGEAGWVSEARMRGLLNS